VGFLMVWCLLSVTSRRLNVRNFHCVLFCWYLDNLEIIRKLLYILTMLQHLTLEVVVQLSPAFVWESGVIVHLTSKGIHTHHNTIIYNTYIHRSGISLPILPIAATYGWFAL